MDHEWILNGPKMDPKSTLNRPLIDPKWTLIKWTQNEPWMDPKWTLNGPWVDLEWIMNGPWMDSEWTLNGVQKTRLTLLPIFFSYHVMKILLLCSVIIGSDRMVIRDTPRKTKLKNKPRKYYDFCTHTSQTLVALSRNNLQRFKIILLKGVL